MSQNPMPWQPPPPNPQYHLYGLPPLPQFPQQGPPPYDPGQDAAMRLVLPVGRSTWAILSGYLGLISVLCIPAPFAILTGILAILEMKRNPKLHGMGRAIFGIVMGVIFSQVMLGLLILLAIDAM